MIDVIIMYKPIQMKSNIRKGIDFMSIGQMKSIQHKQNTIRFDLIYDQQLDIVEKVQIFCYYLRFLFFLLMIMIC